MLKLNDIDLLNKFHEVRKNTLSILDLLESEDTVLQTQPFVSPIKWHVAHTTWFFENFILKDNLDNYKSFDADYNFLFNSYYNKVGKFHQKFERGYVSRPTLSKVLDYRKYVDEKITFLYNGRQNLDHLNFPLELGINHEQQHQELILMDILNIFFHNPIKPSFQKKKIKIEKDLIEKKWIKIPEAKFNYGARKGLFSYDNEMPNNSIEIESFEIQSHLVTNKDWKNFIENGGYKNPEYWLSDGWNFINEEKIERPMYWINEEQVFTLNGLTEILDNQPVSHISFYEADAFARFSNKRLPTEFELELILSKTKTKGNFLENGNMEPIGNTSNEETNFYGDLWSWTKSNYLPYKNYKPFNGSFSEYNGKFMCNQFVLKGGSCITPKDHIRPSYRNFYYPSDRWHFSGMRMVNT